MEVRKCYPVGTHWKRVACLVLPSLKVRGLGWADTEHDSQNFWVIYPLGRFRVEASAAYLNKGKVKARAEGDHLEVGFNPGLRGGGNRTPGGVSIGSGNCWMLPTIQPLDRLGKNETIGQIRVVRVATVPSPKASVHGELGELGESSLFCRPCSLTTGQGAELFANKAIEVLRVRAFRF